MPTHFESEFVTLKVNGSSRFGIELGPKEYLEINLKNYKQTYSSSSDKERRTLSQNQINNLLVLTLLYLYSICFDGNHSFP